MKARVISAKIRNFHLLNGFYHIFWNEFYNDDPDFNKKLRAMGMLVVEMETAGLYLTAQRAGKSALSILTVSDHVFTGASLSALERQDSFHEMMEIALETAWESID